MKIKWILGGFVVTLGLSGAATSVGFTQGGFVLFLVENIKKKEIIFATRLIQISSTVQTFLIRFNIHLQT